MTDKATEAAARVLCAFDGNEEDADKTLGGDGQNFLWHEYITPWEEAHKAFTAESAGDYGEVAAEAESATGLMDFEAVVPKLIDAIERLVAERDTAQQQFQHFQKLVDEHRGELEQRAEAAEDTANACRVDWADVKQHLGAALDDALDRFIESTELAQQERADVLAARGAELESEIDCCCNAVNDALSVSGSDFVRVRACMKRLRANLEDKE